MRRFHFIEAKNQQNFHQTLQFNILDPIIYSTGNQPLYMCYDIQHYLKPGKLNLGLCYPILALSKEPVLDNKLSISIGTLGPNFSLDGLMPRRSHLRRGDHIYPRAITSCPGHALCLTWQIKCTCSGDHIRAWCQE